MKAKIIQEGTNGVSPSERTFALIFDKGDAVIGGLTAFAKDRSLTAGHLTAIGAFSDLTVGFFDWETKDYTKIPIREQVEVLFYIVKHGIKFTGMPAWPALGRDDEVWAMVAFLRRFSEQDAEEYRRLAQGDATPSGEAAPLPDLVGPESVPRAITTSCARCHGVNGLGRGLGAFPKLAGQTPAYLDLSLQAFASGQRHSGIMQPIAAGLSQEEMRELARYYASLPEPSPSAQQAPSAIERGRMIARHGLPSQRVPACAACHGPGVAPRNPVYPELAGQYADYLVLQLEIFKKNVRGGTDYAHIMRQVAAGLTPEQMCEVALYYASLPTATEPPVR